MQTIDLKKPRYVGTRADLIGIQVMQGKTSHREKERRIAIGQALLGEEVFVLRCGHQRVILTDNPPQDLPDGFEIEAKALIQWVGSTGEILIQFVQ